MPFPEAESHRARTRPTARQPGAAAAAAAAGAPHPGRRVSLRQLLRVTSIAGGIQFGWALQLSLLTPYVQELGIPHKWASVIWLCGPLSGLVVQPLVGHMSDRCTSRFGRRKPFIAAGAALIVLAVLIIGHSADIGWLLGDRGGGIKPRAIAVFVFGFWILDVANNMTQGPCRALLADLTGKDHRRTRVANAYFSLFMAVGNILGFATGSFSGWFKIFPFTVTAACNVSCANLKSAFYLDIVFMAITAYVSISASQESPLSLSARSATLSEEVPGQSGHAEEAFLWELFGTFRYFPWTVWTILLVTALNWIGWFPFLLFDTDWMGREIYGGEPNVGYYYNTGVRVGAFGLMLNSVILGITSVLMEKLCRKWGAGFIWGISNIFMALCFLSMLILSYVASHMGYLGYTQPPDGIVAAALVIFAFLGAPLAITYSVPYALVSSRIEPLGLGQGLSMGVLNLAIVTPQVVVSLGAGPWDQLFGGGNSPALAVGGLAALLGGLIAIVGIPRSSVPKPRSLT
ncbi:Sucrose transport protein suc4 [Turnera subulata]|uniref:Sucrose transport protein suc4 n=1 Tax=Turnera subulata TaxID=218843 RepID=A0A9Q0GI48_9ROSI|nr:Sucrose transport protein suc4 [Turnera subulata]